MITRFFLSTYLILLPALGLAELAMPLPNLAKWESYPKEYCPHVGQTFSEKERFLNIIKLNEFMSSDDENASFRSKFKQFVLASFLIKGGSKQRKILDKIDQEMDIFLARGKKFDPQMDENNLSRAKTNMWVILVLEKLFGMSLAVTDPSLGYSLLYPLTDDLFDNPQVKKEDKKRFVQAFDKQIVTGNMPIDEIEGLDAELKPLYQKIWQAFALIEKNYDRKKYPELYQSLVNLHRSQIQSTIQQLPKGSSPAPLDTLAGRQFLSDVTDISFLKGALSVRSDAFLVKGHLHDQEISFANHFGAISQLVNDIGTVAEDIEKENHYTMANLAYATAKAKGKLQSPEFKETFDTFTNRVFWYVHEVFEYPEHKAIVAFRKQKYIDFYDNIRLYMTVKFIMAVAKNAEFHSEAFLNHMRVFSPLPFTLLGKLQVLQEKQIKLSDAEKKKLHDEIESGTKGELKELFSKIVEDGEVNNVILPGAGDKPGLRTNIRRWLFHVLTGFGRKK